MKMICYLIGTGTGKTVRWPHFVKLNLTVFMGINKQYKNLMFKVNQWLKICGFVNKTVFLADL